MNIEQIVVTFWHQAMETQIGLVMVTSTSSTKGDISRHSEVVKFKHIRNTSKSEKKSRSCSSEAGVDNNDDDDMQTGGNWVNYDVKYALLDALKTWRGRGQLS